MNPRQAAFFRQARSDWAVFRHLHAGRSGRWPRVRAVWCSVVGVRPASFPVCHELHYLQMATEKLAKAYYQTDLKKSHEAFRLFLRDVQPNRAARPPLGFPDAAAVSRWAFSVKPIADAVEDLAPAIADKKLLPNPEYPWPRANPTTAPVDHTFQTEVYQHFQAQERSGEPPFLVVLGRMFATMQTAGWHL